MVQNTMLTSEVHRLTAEIHQHFLGVTGAGTGPT